MELWIQMLQHSFIGSVVILLVVVLSAVVKNRFWHKYKKYLWLLISLWLLVPVSPFESSRKLVIPFPEVSIGKMENSEVNSEENVENNSIMSEDELNKEQNNGKELTNENNGDSLIYNLIFWIWICGEVVLLFYFGIGYILNYSHTVHQSIKCDNEELYSVLKSISAAYGIKRLPQLYLTKDKEKGPFTIGVFRKKIFVPDREYIPKDLQYIFSHEIIHCRENDTGIKFLLTIVNIMHWFNPFVWLMVRSAEQDMELCCDEIVLEKSSLEERKEYSEVIMSCIHTGAVKRFSFSSGYVNNTKFMKRRFENIFNTGNRRQGFIFCICLIMFLIIGSGYVELEQRLIMPFGSKTAIDSGFEVRTDVNGDGKQDRVFIKDNISGDHAFTQLAVELHGENDITFTDFEGYWSSYLVSGDLSGNGRADIVVMRISTGSTFGGGEVNVLHFEKNKWVEYPSLFIQNPEISIQQPENFEEDNFDVSCLGAAIIEKAGRTMLRLILNEDIMNDKVKCVDCSYQNDGWYIENIEVITNYYEQERDKELLKNNF